MAKTVKIFDSVLDKFNTIDRTTYIKYPELTQLSKALNVKLKGYWEYDNKEKVLVEFYYKHGVIYEKIGRDVPSYIAWNPMLKIYEYYELANNIVDEKFNCTDAAVNWYHDAYNQTGMNFIGKSI
jgi:hypothetical protein